LLIRALQRIAKYLAARSKHQQQPYNHQCD
jgi:hypothetical protein